MNAAELAKLLGVHVDTIRRKIRSGEIEARQGDGRSYEIPEAEVQRLIGEHENKAETMTYEQAEQTVIASGQQRIQELEKEVLSLNVDLEKAEKIYHLVSEIKKHKDTIKNIRLLKHVRFRG